MNIIYIIFNLKSDHKKNSLFYFVLMRRYSKGSWELKCQSRNSGCLYVITLTLIDRRKDNSRTDYELKVTVNKTSKEKHAARHEKEVKTIRIPMNALSEVESLLMLPEMFEATSKKYEKNHPLLPNPNKYVEYK